MMMVKIIMMNRMANLWMHEGENDEHDKDDEDDEEDEDLWMHEGEGELGSELASKGTEVELHLHLFKLNLI